MIKRILRLPKLIFLIAIAVTAGLLLDISSVWFQLLWTLSIFTFLIVDQVNNIIHYSDCKDRKEPESLLGLAKWKRIDRMMTGYTETEKETLRPACREQANYSDGALQREAWL